MISLRLNPDGLHKPIGCYSQVARRGNMVAASGMASIDLDDQVVGPNDITAQTIQTLTNLKAALAGAGRDAGRRHQGQRLSVRFRPLPGHGRRLPDSLHQRAAGTRDAARGPRLSQPAGRDGGMGGRGRGTDMTSVRPSEEVRDGADILDQRTGGLGSDARKGDAQRPGLWRPAPHDHVRSPAARSDHLDPHHRQPSSMSAPCRCAARCSGSSQRVRWTFSPTAPSRFPCSRPEDFREIADVRLRTRGHWRPSGR